MAKRYSGGRVFALLLILCSCTAPFHRWAFDQTITSRPEYNSGKVYYSQKTLSSGMDLEFLKGSSGLRCYLITQGRPFRTQTDNPSKVAIFIVIENKEQPTHAHRLKGGQKLLLDQKTTQMIIQALLKGKTITIIADRYQMEVVPDQFEQAYQQLLQIPIAER